MKEGEDYEIVTDGRTVWVNTGELLGRFGPNGIDVHKDGVCAGDGCEQAVIVQT